MDIKLNRKDLKDFFAEKYPDMEIDNITIVDDDGNTTESIPDECACKEAECIDCGDDDIELTRESTPEEFVKATGIAKILQKALKDQNYASKIPDDPVATCEEAAGEFFEEMKRRDKRTIFSVVNTKNLKKFLVLWQDYQNFIHKKL